MENRHLLVLCFALILPLVSAKIILKDNGYEGIVIAINPQIPEDPELIEAIKSTWTNASKFLFEATKKRVFFRNVTILIPATWTEGSYASTTHGESYSAADVLVSEANPAFGEFPYTLQYGECGKPGQYIHITPNYLREQKYVSDTGDRGKVITHEWAHLRWGVFDEVPTNGYEEFYLQNRKIEATRCSKSLQGLNRVIDYDHGTIDLCPLNATTLLPEPGCEFIPNITQPEGLETSLMGHQYLEQITSFCHSNTSDPINRHNTAAPNEHNALCNLRSTWDVIMDTGDFAGGQNLPNSSVSDTTPTFEVVQSSSSRYVLVMDVSGSMETFVSVGSPETRLDIMKIAASEFVTTYVAEGSYVGLVSFETYSYKLSELQIINKTSRADLETIIRRTRAAGWTAIGKGILTGLEVLNDSGNCEGNLVVLTDGDENVAPLVADVYDEVINCNAKMYTIFLDLSSLTVNKNMILLSEESGGDWFFADSTSTATIDTFRKVSENNDGDSLKNTFQIHSNVFTLDPYVNQTHTVVIDSTVGNNTHFLFTWATSPPNVLLESPSGCFYGTYIDPSLSYCPDQPIHTVDTTLRAYKFNVAGTAPVGKWIYRITGSSENQTVRVTVTSKASNVKVPPIEVDARLALNNITSSVATVMYAKITQGFSAVLNANVTEIITTPSSNAIQVQLFDNGAGADIRKDDGIYSRYFHSYENQGRYSVQVKVNGNVGSVSSSRGSPAAFNPGVVDDGIFVPNPNGRSNLPINTVPVNPTTEEFERVESGGSFSYSGPVNPEDVWAPNRVTDLRGKQLNITDLDKGVYVEITFTAPGDDLDSGFASSYEIRYSFENPTFILDNFKESILVEQNVIVEGSLILPLEASNLEKFVFKVPNNTEEETGEVFIAMMAYDDVGNPSDVSNIRPITLFFNRTALPQLLPENITEKTEDDSSTTPTWTTIKTTSARPVVPDNNLKTFQILTGVFGALALALGVATIALAFKLSKRNSQLARENPYKTHVNNAYDNQYSGIPISRVPAPYVISSEE